KGRAAPKILAANPLSKARVSQKHFVAPLAIEHYLDTQMRSPAHDPTLAQDRKTKERFIHTTNQLLKFLSESVGLRLDLNPLNACITSCEGCKVRFVSIE